MATEGTCEEEGCSEPAERRVHWPGEGYIEYCEKHAEKALAIANSLGMGLGVVDD